MDHRYGRSAATRVLGTLAAGRLIAPLVVSPDSHATGAYVLTGPLA